MILLLTENQLILVNTNINIVELSIIRILFAKKKSLYFLYIFVPPSQTLWVIMLCCFIRHFLKFAICLEFKGNVTSTSPIFNNANILQLILNKNTVDRKKSFHSIRENSELMSIQFNFLKNGVLADQTLTKIILVQFVDQMQIAPSLLLSNGLHLKCYIFILD